MMMVRYHQDANRIELVSVEGDPWPEFVHTQLHRPQVGDRYRVHNRDGYYDRSWTGIEGVVVETFSDGWNALIAFDHDIPVMPRRTVPDANGRSRNTRFGAHEFGVTEVEFVSSGHDVEALLQPPVEQRDAWNIGSLIGMPITLTTTATSTTWTTGDS